MSPIFAAGKGSKIRKADHAGSWYSSNSGALRSELQDYLNRAPSAFHDQPAPIGYARVIIAPHAGFRYSGPTAGVAYKAFALQASTKNIFVLGPSHHVYLDTATVSGCDELETPLGNLIVNKAINEELQKSSLFGTVNKRNEEAEHSMEMQFPFIKLLIDKVFSQVDANQHPKVVPIMIGNASAATEKLIGDALVPYLKDASNVFVISSDFAHWGRRFNYTYYLPSLSGSIDSGENIRSDSQTNGDVAIHESIAHVDHACTRAIASGRHAEFQQVLAQTGNTVCGRHPIGVIMSAITALQAELGPNISSQGEGQIMDGNEMCFKFTDYQRSGLVDDVDESSVSYASAYAVVKVQ